MNALVMWKSAKSRVENLARRKFFYCRFLSKNTLGHARGLNSPVQAPEDAFTMLPEVAPDQCGKTLRIRSSMTWGSPHFSLTELLCVSGISKLGTVTRFDAGTANDWERAFGAYPLTPNPLFKSLAQNRQFFENRQFFSDLVKTQARGDAKRKISFTSPNYGEGRGSCKDIHRLILEWAPKS